jgi:hypothetical protein
VRTVNSTMVLAYWHVGREIVEFVQRGAKRAEYGERHPTIRTLGYRSSPLPDAAGTRSPQPL